jgi:alpha-D-xyloside xylohydrolase
VYTGKDALFTLYEDEGTNYNYEKGAFSKVPFDYNEKTKTLSIGNRTGDYPGMLKTRTFKIVKVASLGAQAFDILQNSGITINYTGEKVNVKL